MAFNISFRNSRHKKQKGRKRDPIFDGKVDSGLSNLRDSIFNSRLSPTPDREAGRPCSFYLPDELSESLYIPSDKAAVRNKVHVDCVGKEEDVDSRLQELLKLKNELVGIQGRLESQDESILAFRQDLLKRMVQYIEVVKSIDRTSAENKMLVDIKTEFDSALKKQQQLVIDLRQNKLKSLAQLKQSHEEHSNQLNIPSSLMRQKSRSAETIYDVKGKAGHKNVIAQVEKVKRSQTTRTDRTQYLGDLAKRTGNAIRRNISHRNERRRLSTEDLYSPLSKTHLARSPSGTKLKSKQSFLKMNPSGQLVFDSEGKSSPEKRVANNVETQTMVSQYDNVSVTTSNYSPSKAVFNTETSAISIQSDNRVCHAADSSMFSSDKDFVEIDDLIHFIQTHKDPVKRFVRGYNAVNSASFREGPAFATDNTSSEMPGVRRDQIVIPSNAIKLSKTGKQASLDHDIHRQNPATIETPRSHMSPSKTDSLIVPSAHLDVPNSSYKVGRAQNDTTLSRSVKSERITHSKNVVVGKTATLLHPTLSTENKGVQYQNFGAVVSIDLKRGIANVQDKAHLQEISLIDPSSPLQPSSQYYDLIGNKETQTVVDPSYEMGGVSRANEDVYAVPPKGNTPAESKPRLLKKPPRKSTRLKRAHSQSLTDLTDAKPRRRDRSKSNKRRPNSFVHEYANISDVQKNVPHIYVNVDDKDPKSNKHDCMNIEYVSKDSNKTYQNENKDTTKDTNSQTKVLESLKPKVLVENQPDVISKCTHLLPPDSNNKGTPSKRTLRRSASDMTDSDKKEQMKRILIDEISKLTEIQDDLKDTENTVRVMWANMKALGENKKPEAQPKRATLPFAMTPNFPKEKKCTIL